MSHRKRRFSLLPNTVRGRLTVTYALAFALFVGVFGFLVSRAFHDRAQDQFDSALATQAALAGQAVSAMSERSPAPDWQSTSGEISTAANSRVTIFDADGVVLGDSQHEPALMSGIRGRSELGATLRTGIHTWTLNANAVDPDYRYVAVFLPPPDNLIVRVGKPLADIMPFILQSFDNIVVAMVAAALFAALVGMFVAGRITSPLEALQYQAAEAARGRLDVSVNPASTRELGDLGKSFNAMTKRLNASVMESRQVRDRLEVTLRNLTDGVIVTNDRGLIILLNDAARGMVRTTGDLIGHPVVEVVRDHELSALLRNTLDRSDRDEQSAELTHSRTGRMIHATARRLDTADETIGLLIMRDVTELRRLENVRREFVAGVSHELRTPLASIRLLAETLEAGDLDPAMERDFLGRITAEVVRLTRLVDDVLDLARIESGRLQLDHDLYSTETLIRGGVDRIMAQVERARLTLSFELADELPTVRVDRGRIEQVLINLIHNAIKFTPVGGTIVVSARDSGSFVEISVADNGQGVSADELPRLFERFYKADRARRSEGSGLGLAISKHIVQEHGGEIWAESTRGEGSIFTFTLPAVDTVRTGHQPSTGRIPVPSR